MPRANCERNVAENSVFAPLDDAERRILDAHKSRSDAERQKLQFFAATVKNSPNYELSNGGFYMAPSCDPVEFSVHSNGFEGSLSADAAGITVCLFTFSHLSFQQPSDDVFSRHFYALREFALDHKQAGLIFAAID